MALPLHLQMEIDIHAQLHRKEIEEGFANLRKELFPAPGTVFVDCAFTCSPGHIVLNDPSAWRFDLSQLQSCVVQ